MHILLTNDDGPPSNQSSPYVHSLVKTLQDRGHIVSVVLPHTQRSWIGKAHMVGQVLTPTYFRPGTLHQDDGITQNQPFNDGKEEWVLLDGTPASCTQIGAWHLFNDRGPIDVIVSGPNYGRNTTAVFALSSGTLGAALEGACLGKKSIAISYAFDSREHDPKIIAGASKVAAKLIEKFTNEWPEDVQVYTINVPLRPNVESEKIVYTHMLQNKWTSGSCFAALPAEVEDKEPTTEEAKIRHDQDTTDGRPLAQRKHVSYKWSPNFADVRDASAEAKEGDGWHVMQGHITVTPIKANYWHLPKYVGEIKLTENAPASKTTVHAFLQHPEPYVQPLIKNALQNCTDLDFKVVDSSTLPGSVDVNCLQIADYEQVDFERAMNAQQKFLVCAYAIRKALIRKHYLANTVGTWLVKHPDSILRRHVKPSVHFELDYAEFLDEALVDAWDLHESMIRNETNDGNKEWWILKPGMSDGAHGIRLFSSMEQLQAIFEEWDPESDEENENEESDTPLHESRSATDGEPGHEMTSQLRHFVVQPYIDPPLLLPAHGNRKFHIRTYVVVVGALKVYVYREMLALFSAQAYRTPDEDGDRLDLARHLTNTCLQDETSKATSVHRYWALESPLGQAGWQEDVFRQICDITGQVFEAAAREQMIHFQTMPNAFEVFGLDFLVDETYTSWLLEVNAYPDFKQTGLELQELVVGGLWEEIIRIAIVPFFSQGQGEIDITDRMTLVADLDLGRGSKRRA